MFHDYCRKCGQMAIRKDGRFVCPVCKKETVKGFKSIATRVIKNEKKERRQTA